MLVYHNTAACFCNHCH